ncbi:MAG TPA: Sir2 family NAD-dependent protein deacetylase [Noviherbaspirillum sp.]|uniref:SIR2 family NAD-dependent protein deacylase n=1 Tax=Noviherbaspirillum sp. TaxID=1926288 RepID=UPI002D729724|nr:Sir2 family NAD-dependent protein deacetylase [Noviherbaspirillum sp.]HYD96587.1 Sir2 family NAD-dependent protein deacetylase [Noviherbaspirillum sp.]
MKTPSTAATATFGLEPAGYRKLLDQFTQARRILVYSGAGLSADSGLPTYRGAGRHLWTGDTVRRVATLEGYARDPAFAVEWYIEQGGWLHAARPHEGHRALQALDAFWQVTHVTQNVDVLLEAAGCAKVLHLHGRYDELRCLNCDWHGRAARPEDLRPPCPNCGGQRRPSIVWLGEMPDAALVAQAEADAAAAELVLVIGTPAEMYPGAAIVETAHRAGAGICVINPEWCENLHYAHWQLFGTAHAVLPGLARDALARRQAEGRAVPWYWRWLAEWVR